mgnify:CR=1 FL=1
MIPLYIIGLLQRYGPQHGYQIKKIIGEQLSDFTQIKLPTIYYHLENMEANGLLMATRLKPGGRPEKTVYNVTSKGRQAFQSMLDELLEFDYHPSFVSDGIFYFSDSLSLSDMTKGLENHIKNLKEIIERIQKHQNETLQFVPEEMKPMVLIIFNHHLYHYRAELDWAVESLSVLKGE